MGVEETVGRGEALTSSAACVEKLETDAFCDVGRVNAEIDVHARVGPNEHLDATPKFSSGDSLTSRNKSAYASEVFELEVGGA